MRIPLRNRLQMRSQRDVALFEDVLIRILYELDNTVEIHGGTAIWRCYGGRRFSKDIDVYIASNEKWALIKDGIKATAERYGAKVLKLKDTGNLIFIELLLGDIYSEIDVNYKKYYDSPVLKQYETLEGTFYDVLTLPPEILISEKIDAYTDRHYLTDLYDLKVLIDGMDQAKANQELKGFIKSIKPPKDIRQEEERLKGLIYEGPVPSFKSLVDYIRGKIT